MNVSTKNADTKNHNAIPLIHGRVVEEGRGE